MTVEWTAGHSATARRGDAAAVGGSGRRREDLEAAAGTADRDVAARRGDTTAIRESVQPWGRPRDSGVDRVPRSLRPDRAMQRRHEGRCNHGTD